MVVQRPQIVALLFRRVKSFFCLRKACLRQASYGPVRQRQEGIPQRLKPHRRENLYVGAKARPPKKVTRHPPRRARLAGAEVRPYSRHGGLRLTGDGGGRMVLRKVGVEIGIFGRVSFWGESTCDKS
jgi:hypothetical protein